MIASHDHAMTMTAALTMEPAIRPGLWLRRVWLRNIFSWARQRSSPTWSPATTRSMGLFLEATQDGADVLLAAPRELEKDLLQRLSVLSDHVAQVLQAVLHLARTLWIEADGGLVQEEDLRVVKQGGGQ